MTIDLVEESPQAEVRNETGRIDFGTPEADRYLGGGWSEDEHNANGSFIWSDASQSELHIYSHDDRPRQLGFRCWPINLPSSSQSSPMVDL